MEREYVPRSTGGGGEKGMAKTSWVEDMGCRRGYLIMTRVDDCVREENQSMRGMEMTVMWVESSLLLLVFVAAETSRDELMGFRGSNEML